MSSYGILIDNQNVGSNYDDRLQLAAVETLSTIAALPGDLTIVLTNDETVKALNHQYRGIDKATDVLSFPDGAHDPDTGSLYYGDILIAYPTARVQAEEAGHEIEVELALLVVHGILHLAGMDHESDSAKRGMWEMQDRIMSQLDAKLAPGRLEIE